MNTAQRIRILENHGLDRQLIAAIVGADASDIAAHAVDPNVAVVPSQAQVFEVTNLDIPAGTDWSVTPHLIGTVDISFTSLLVPYAYLELDANPTDPGDSVYLSLMSPAGDFYVSANVPGANPGIVWQESETAGQFFNDINSPAAILGTSTATSPPSTVTVNAVVRTAGPTTADITVVGARAAFLVI